MENGHSNFFVSSSDGCAESGWTVYLEHSIVPDSSCSLSRRIGNFDVKKIDDEEEEEVDLSMVSDASSGPRINFPENEFGFPEISTETGRARCFFPTTAAASLPKSGRKIKGTGDERRRCRDPRDQTSSFLDDTASSEPDFNFNSESSSPCQNQFNTLRQSSQSGNRRQKNQWFKGKRSDLR